MRSARSASLVLLLAGACADPAATEVRISVEEPSVDTIELEVRVQDQLRVDCQLPLGTAPEGTCPFSGGEGRWTMESSLSFVLYGEPEQAFEVDVSGTRDGTSITATSAQASLPPSEGERRRLDLALLGRTRPRFDCSLTLSEGLPPAERVNEEGRQSALRVLPATVDPRAARFAPLTLLVSARNALAAVSYGRSAEGCALTERPLLDAGLSWDAPPALNDPRRWCNVRENALVARPVDGASGVAVVAGLCANGTSARLKLAVLRGATSIQVTTVPFAVPTLNVSDPVLADTDGDGVPEAFVLVRTPDDSVTLGRAWVGEGRVQTETVPLPGVTLLNGRTFPPLVIPAGDDGPETVLVAGHNGPIALYRAGRVQSLRRTRPSLRPPVAYLAGPGRFGLLTLAGTSRVAHLGLFFERGQWTEREVGLVELASPVSASFEAALTLGRPDADGPLQVALLEDGIAHLVNVESPLEARTVDVWRGAASDAQLTRWANLDGEPGAELLSFDPDGANMAAVRADGTALDGWPIDLPTSGAPRRVLLADLDGPAGQNEDGLRDLEIVSLTDRVLTVVTLGPGSYDFDSLDWPAAGYAPHGTRVWLGSRDPTRVPPP